MIKYRAKLAGTVFGISRRNNLCAQCVQRRFQANGQWSPEGIIEPEFKINTLLPPTKNQLEKFISYMWRVQMFLSWVLLGRRVSVTPDGKEQLRYLLGIQYITLENVFSKKKWLWWDYFSTQKVPGSPFSAQISLNHLPCDELKCNSFLMGCSSSFHSPQCSTPWEELQMY